MWFKIILNYRKLKFKVIQNKWLTILSYEYSPRSQDRWSITFEIHRYLNFIFIEIRCSRNWNFENIGVETYCNAYWNNFLFSDILSSSVEHESSRTTMDHPNIIYRTYLRAALVGQFVVLQQRTLLRVLLYN